MPTEQERRWIDAWRNAAPELERIRNEELRNLDENAGLRFLGAHRRNEPPQHGLAIFQSWMMRWRVLQLMERVKEQTSGKPND